MAGVTPQAAPIAPHASASSKRIVSAVVGAACRPSARGAAAPPLVSCDLTVASLSFITCYVRVARHAEPVGAVILVLATFTVGHVMFLLVRAPVEAGDPAFLAATVPLFLLPA